MMSSQKKELVERLGKEFWGILMFELSLPALYQLVLGDEMGVGLKRFSDWVLFPEKIPYELQERMWSILEKRRNNDRFEELLNRQMTDCEEKGHNLIVELLRLKYLGSSVDPAYLHNIYQLHENVFFALSIQFVERGYLSSRKMMEIYSRFVNAAKGERDD